MEKPVKRPTVGLALRGASLRSIFNIGFLEVLQELQVPVDYIAALSSSTIVAASYACGTLTQLRDQFLSLDKDVLSGLIAKSQTKAGVYNLDKVEEEIRVYTRNLKFEEVKPLLGFITADINRGEEVVLGMGDIARAARASCTLPWLFEPLQWGTRTLVDGGIINMIPGEVVRQAGIDIVIGVDLRTSDYIFGRTQLWLKKSANFIKRLFLLNQAEKLWNNLGEYFMNSEFFGQYPYVEDVALSDYPGKFGILGRAMDLAVAAEKKHKQDQTFGCDLIVRPPVSPVPWWNRMLQLDVIPNLLDLSNTKDLYLLGRQAAAEYAPRIWQLMADHEAKQAAVDRSLQELARHNDGPNWR